MLQDIHPGNYQKSLSETFVEELFVLLNEKEPIYKESLGCCATSDCQGPLQQFENTIVKCGFCGVQHCNQCLEVISAEDGHRCVSTIAESVQEVLRESRPCPLCGERISKVSGCDDMFCVKCHCGFSYGAGNLIRREFHNIHLQEYRATIGEDIAPDQQVVLDGEDFMFSSEVFDGVDFYRRNCDTFRWIQLTNRTFEKRLFSAIYGSTYPSLEFKRTPEQIINQRLMLHFMSQIVMEASEVILDLVLRAKVFHMQLYPNSFKVMPKDVRERIEESLAEIYQSIDPLKRSVEEKICSNHDRFFGISGFVLIE
jgi:hypothetical protein